MATRDRNEENQALNTKAEEKQQPETIVDEVGARSCLIANKVTPLIATVALFLAGYSYFTSNHLNQNKITKNQQLTKALHLLEEQQKSFEQQLHSKNNDQQRATHEIEQKIDQLSKQIQNLANQKDNQSQDWLLLKARYYLELAQINAHWSAGANDRSTSELLQQADNILGQINTSDLFEIRQTIAKEILSLKTANKLDVPGLLSQLDALQNSISQISIQAIINTDNDMEAKTEESPSNQAAWKQHWHDSLEILSKLVVIRHNDEPIKPLLSPIYESILKESIRLNLQEAQWALINTNSSAYRLALTQAIATLKRGFNQHLSNTKALLEQLNKLQKTPINPAKFEVNQALLLLNQLIEQKQTTAPAEKREQEL